mgnify:FL=1
MTPAEAAEAVKVQVQTDKERIEQQVIARYPRLQMPLEMLHYLYWQIQARQLRAVHRVFGADI